MTYQSFKELAEVAYPLWLECIKPYRDNFIPLTDEQLKIVDKFVGMSIKIAIESNIRTSKQQELVNIFQYWLDINEKNHKADGNIVTDEMHVYPPEYPTRKVLKEWIKILTQK